MFFGNLLHLRYPVTGERALVGIIKDKAVLGCLGMLGALPEFRWLGIQHKGQIHQADSTVRYVCSLEALVSQKLWISEKFPLSSLGAQDADAPPGLRPGVPDTRVQKVIGISMPFHCACDPQAVDIEISLCLNGHPCVFCGNVFDKALAALLAAVKNKPLVKALPEPFLFYQALLAGHCAADVFFVYVFFCNMDVIHRFLLKCSFVPRTQINAVQTDSPVCTASKRLAF